MLLASTSLLPDRAPSTENFDTLLPRTQNSVDDDVRYNDLSRSFRDHRPVILDMAMETLLMSNFGTPPHFCRYIILFFYVIAKLLLGNPVVDVTLFKIEFCTKICVGFLGTYP